MDEDHAPIQPLTSDYPPRRYCTGGFANADTIDGHPPADHQYRGKFVGLFREPVALKVSLFGYIRRMIGSSSGSGYLARWFLQSMMDPGRARELVDMAVATRNATAGSAQRCAYVRGVLERMQGGMSKMVAFGEYLLDLPHERRHADNSDGSAPHTVDGLMRVLGGGAPQSTRDAKGEAGEEPLFLFMGLTERWEESVCLFHAVARTDMASNGGLPVPLQLANTRPNHQEEEDVGLEEEASVCGLTKLLSEDELDAALYSHAARTFTQQLATVQAEEATRARPPIYKHCMRRAQALASRETDVR